MTTYERWYWTGMFFFIAIWIIALSWPRATKESEPAYHFTCHRADAGLNGIVCEKN